MKTILNQEVAHQKYFEEMTRIPHGSYNEQAYSDYLVAFAKEHHYAYRQDDLHNVIIYKQAAKGYEDHPCVLLQAHMDMVCEKNKDTEFDFEKDALALYIEDGFLKAKGTTLGADNGVGVAYMLALLEDAEALHPALECVFTVQEEVGLYGAMAIKKEDIHAKRMINLDDGGETATCITSAGGMNVIMKRERILVPTQDQGYILEVKGLSGGHSGGQIHKEKGNANKLLARILFALNEQQDVRINCIQGGIKDNAIPREASAIFVSDGAEDKILACVAAQKKAIQAEYECSDAQVEVTTCKTECHEAMSIEDSELLCNLLMTLPNGLRHRSMSIPGLSTASSNIGVISSTEDEIIINCSLRGAMESYIDTLAMEMDCLADTFLFDYDHEARYPAWSYRADSKMRETLQEICRELYEQELELVSVHGGLECGVFMALDEDMDIVTMGPKMQDIHTPQEALDLASFDRTFTFLKTYLTRL